MAKLLVSRGLAKCVKRHPVICAVDATVSVGAAYLWNSGFNYLPSTMSLCCIGGTYLYCRAKSRDRLSPNHAIVLTGCDSGLGYSLALHCRDLGATVIAGVLEYDGLGARKLKEKNIFVHPLDVTKTESVVDFTSYVQALLRENDLALRCLVNNAAVMIFGEFEWQAEDQIRSQVEVNFLGTMRITRELIPTIRAHSSRIIVISSHCNIQPIPGVAAYSGTKAAINAWATAIRVELKKHGVRVVCFIPGSFVTESNILARQAEHFEAMRKSMSEEARAFYGDYFTRYSQYFSSVSQGASFEKLQDSGIYEVFEGALLDKYPSAIYKNETWRYFVYHTLFNITPTCLRDLLVQKFVQGPPWTRNALGKAQIVDESQSLDGKARGSSTSEIVKRTFEPKRNEKEKTVERDAESRT